MLTRLATRQILKPWGRDDVPAPFGPVAAGERLGEIWFERESDGQADALLVKYLFTSERLSIQVHPDDTQARQTGEARGKDEAWLVLSADSHAEIGIGLKQPLDKVSIAAAALEGKLEEHVDWRRVEVGEAYYSPAGTIHAIGPGVTILEIQQNSDLTYRLYDYGRGRDLHLAEALDAVRPDRRIDAYEERSIDAGRSIAVAGPKFTVERWSYPAKAKLHASEGRKAWLVPITGTIRADGARFDIPGAWIADSPCDIALEPSAELFVAYEGTDPIEVTAL